MNEKQAENPYASPESESDQESAKVSLGAAARRGAKIGALSGVALVIGGCIVIGVFILVTAIRLELRAEGGFWFAIERWSEDRTVFEIIGRFTAACAVFAAWGAAFGAIFSMASAWSRRRTTPRG
jgi:hypothetical protein